MNAVAPRSIIVHRYSVGGMTCSACAQHVEQALAREPGVHAARVDSATRTVRVEVDEPATSFATLRRAVANAGYALEPIPDATASTYVLLGPLLWGLAAATALLVFYLGLITVAQGWGHALQQLIEDRWFVGAITVGFGAQVGLFAYLRILHGRASTGGVAASTGTSTAAMLACCAHHLTDILPLIGLSGAAVVLNLYKTPLLWLGIGMNAVGIGYMLWQIHRQRVRLCLLDTDRTEPLMLDPTTSAVGCH